MSVQLLTYWPSPYGNRVVMALKLKQVEYHIISSDPWKKSQLLLDSNPVHKKIPVLLHNGKSICESHIIVQYIEDCWPDSHPPLLPAHPYDRYLVRFWADFIDKKILAVAVLGMEALAGGERGEEARKEYAELFVVLESALSELRTRGCIYAEGGSMGFLDLCFASCMGWFPPLEKLGGLVIPNSEKCPLLNRWMEDLKKNPVVNETLPDPSHMMEYAKKRFNLQ